MPQRPIGVNDQVPVVPVTVDWRVRERVVSAVTVDEQYVVFQRERIASSLAYYSAQNFVTAAADTSTGWRWMLQNPTGSGVTVALRDLYIVATQVNISFATISAPQFTLERRTVTGTATGGTVLAPSRVNTAQAPAVVFYTAAPTGLTITTGAIAWTFFPSVNFSTTTTEPRAHWPVVQDYHTTDPSLELAPGEALVFRQSTAGTTSEFNSRTMLTNVLVEEFTKP
jgi:hypothetical protein